MIVMILSLKIADVVLSIFAFATTTSFTSSSSFTVNCRDNTTAAATTHTVTFHYGYPFDLEKVCIRSPVCGSEGGGQGGHGEHHQGRDVCLLSGPQASAQFFVFVGVLVMLYCLAALVVYIFFDDFYRKDNRVIIVDFVVSVVLTALWLVSSSAWAAGVVEVKGVTDPVQGAFLDHPRFPDCLPAAHTCAVTTRGNFGSLNASVIFGFFNLLVWLSNLWFLYKETPWFKIQSKPAAGALRRPSDLQLQLDIDLDPHKV